MNEDWLAVLVGLGLIGLVKVGWKPVPVYFLATAANTALALGAAWALFGSAQ